MKKILLSVLMLSVLVLGMGMASAVDWDLLEIKNIDLNGVDQVTVAPSEIIAASVQVQNDGEFDFFCHKWSSTQYTIEGYSPICINVPEPDTYCGIHTRGFQITAPSAEGTYDFEVKVYEQENCVDYEDDSMLIEGIIVVEPAICGDGEMNQQSEDCDDGNLNNEDGCSSTCQIETGWECDGEPSVCEDVADPEILNVYTMENYPMVSGLATCSESVKVCAEITDNDAVKSAKIVCYNDYYISPGDNTAKTLIPQGNDEYCSELFSPTSMGADDAHEIVCIVETEDYNENTETQMEDPLWTYDCAAPEASFICDEYGGDEPLTIQCTDTSIDSVDTSLDLLWSDLETDSVFDITYNQNGTYTVTLTATDDVGNSDVHSETIIVDDVAPVPDFTYPAPVKEGVAVTFTDTTSSHDPVISLTWDIEGVITSGSTATYAFPDNGNYDVSLEVCDAEDCVTETKSIAVENVAPAVTINGNTSCDEADSITLSVSATDVAADTISYLWSHDSSTANTATYNCENGDASPSVTITVSDEDGGVTPVTYDITIDNVKPDANANGPYNAAVDYQVCFNGNATDVWDTSFTYEWDFSYNASEGFMMDSTSEDPCTTYHSTGEVTIAVRAKDDFDWSDVVTTTVTVHDYMLPLDEGWNLISIPLVPEESNTSIEKVFESIKDDVLVVWAYTYNSVTFQNEWTYHEIDGSFNSAATLKNIVPGYGYYVKMANETELYLNGEFGYEVGEEDNSPVIGMPPSVTLAMDSWNLIGKFGMGDHLCLNHALESLEDQDNNRYYDIIYNELGEDVKHLDSMEGYWLSVKKVFDNSNTIEYKANYKVNTCQA